MGLYLAKCDDDHWFIFTSRSQYGFDKGNELYTYEGYVSVNRSILENRDIVANAYPSLRSCSLCGGDYEIENLI